MELKRLSDDELRMELNGIVEILDLVMEEMHKDVEGEVSRFACLDTAYYQRKIRETYYPIFEKLTNDLTRLHLRLSKDC